MRYTIVIPVYNGEETINDCLSAVVAQDGFELGRDYNVVVVDDGSTDKTAEIVSGFPVELVELGTNKGRIIARVTGARHAKMGKLVFVDSRIIPEKTVLSCLSDYEEYPAIMGSYDARKAKYKSLFDTVFFLIRRKFYGADNFPQSEPLLLIGPENFKRAPKGTTLLCIDKELFLELTPERTDRSVNDDTLLFQNLVYEKKLPLVRADKVRFEYLQRTALQLFIPWLYERGVRFADFYLRPGGYLFLPFLVVLLLTVVLTLALLAMVLSQLSAIFLLPLTLLLVFAIIALYLSECGKDFVVTLFVFPVIITVFSAGICSFYVRNFIRN